MAKIVLYTSGTLGDHLPFIALGRALAEGGHEVRLAANKAMHSHVRRSGLEAVSLGEEDLGPQEARRDAWAWDFWKCPDPSSHPQAPSVPFESYMVQVHNLLELCKGADILISTAIRLQGFIVARALKMPWLTASLNPYTFWAPATPKQARDQYQLRQKEYRRFSVVANLAFEELGVDERVGAWSPGWLYARHILLAAGAHFGKPDLDQFQPNTSIDMTGFWFYQDPRWSEWRPDEDLLRVCEPADPNRKPIVLSFSSQPLLEAESILQRHVRAAAALNRPLVIQRGWADFSESQLPPDVDSGNVLFTDFIPHDWLFARAACTIQHGGIGSIARALAHGCPVLVEPFGNDQLFNANLVERLGVGAALHPYESEIEDLVDAVRNKVLTPDCRHRAKTLGEKIKTEHGLETACEMIERYLGRIGPDGDLPKIYGRFAPPLGRRPRRPMSAGTDIQGGAVSTVAPTDETKNAIPKIIHQTWQNHNLPQDMAAWQRTWLKHHPDWTYYLWTDEDKRRFLNDHYSWFLPVYDGYPEEIMRVDAVRYFLLHHYGGVYVDLDFECFRPLEPLLSGKTLFFGLEPEEHARLQSTDRHRVSWIVCNAFMASVPGHPFWEHSFKQLIAYHKAPGVLDATGPFFLTRTCRTYANQSEIHLEPPETLYPIHNRQKWDNLPAEERERIRGTAYGVHHWSGVWWRPIVAQQANQASVLLADKGMQLAQATADLEGCRASLSQSSAPPLISCLMVTRNRPHLAQRAITCFQRQTYPQRELVIVDDSPDDALQVRVDRLQDERIRYLRLLPGGASLGELRNIAVWKAAGEYVAQWDDDDLSDPLRLENQMALIRAYQVEACMLARQILWWPSRRRLAVSTPRIWEGSFVCRRKALPPYPHQRKGEDTPVINRIVSEERVVLLNLPQMYVYVFHGENTFDESHWEKLWAAADEWYEGDHYDIRIRELEERLNLDLSGNGEPPTTEASSPRVPSSSEAPAVGETDESRPAPGPLMEAEEAGPPHPISSPPSPENRPAVLILVPVKDAEPYLPSFLDGLDALTYPPRRLSLAFLEGDSTDDTYGQVQRLLPKLRERYAGVALYKRDYAYRVDKPRWEPGEQIKRRSILAGSRNYLLSRALGEEDWVLWMDVDLARWPKDVIERLLAPGKEIVVPNCLRLGSGATFDMNSFKLKPNAENLDWDSHLINGILQPPAGYGRLYLNDLREHSIVELDAVGGTMLLVKADLHREGLVFPTFPYKRHIETEGLAMMARDMGYSCWGLPNLEIHHPPT